MSKYTKALEKIQTQRKVDATVASNPAVGGFKIPTIDKVTVDHRHYLDRGIERIKNAEFDERVVMLRFPDSMVAEQYRMLRTSLKAILAKTDAKAILVSSSMHSEGKTISAINLAISLAENQDAKVVLVDADLRRGKIGQYLGIDSNRMGLSSLMQEKISAKRAMVQTSASNLFAIPRGPIPRNPSELISSNKMATLIEDLKSRFDHVVIDSPPIMSVADAGILARLVDGILFVVQVGRTPKTVVAHSQQLFSQSGAKMLGCVLTNVEQHSADYKYYNSNYHYYSDEEVKEGFKHRSKFELKKAGWNFKNLEERFNYWWEQNVLKKKKKGE